METQILLAGDLYLIEKGELGPLKKDIAEIERMLKALIKSLENKPLDPLLQLNWRRTLLINFKILRIKYFRKPLSVFAVFFVVIDTVFDQL
ncbi:MAG: hypothetical protein JRE28_08265 [Deltaproteobacteria bacterium]|nr:hypothetical protein [Deltaproteobacteria bacterium]